MSWKDAVVVLEQMDQNQLPGEKTIPGISADDWARAFKEAVERSAYRAWRRDHPYRHLLPTNFGVFRAKGPVALSLLWDEWIVHQVTQKLLGVSK